MVSLSFIDHGLFDNSGGYSVANRRVLLQHLSDTLQYDNGRALGNIISSGALYIYCYLMGAALSQSHDSNLIESTGQVSSKPFFSSVFQPSLQNLRESCLDIFDSKDHVKTLESLVTRLVNALA